MNILGLKEHRNAEALRRDNETNRLVAQAKSLVPFVEGEQPKRLAAFQKSLAADIAAWQFECRRKGDYLAITFTRLTYAHILDRDLKPITTILAVSLSEKPNILLIPGRAPDLNGSAEFTKGMVRFYNDKNWTTVLQFSNVTLPQEQTVIKEEDARVISSSINDATDNGLGVRVNGIARSGTDDRIIIGEGGGSKWDDVMSSIVTSTSSSSNMTFSYNLKDEESLKRQRSGVTINVPYGLGNTVYNQIMDAIAQGSVP